MADRSRLVHRVQSDFCTNHTVKQVDGAAQRNTIHSTDKKGGQNFYFILIIISLVVASEI